MRIACRIASRTTGSPSRATSRPSRFGSSSPGRSQPITRPESISPNAEALIRKLSDPATRRCQSTSSTLSRISRSCVSASGMRSRASARHISITPSCVSRL